MLPTVPGQIATVLVAFAVTELRPSQMSVGNERRVPPPATELMAPARKAEPNATDAVRTLKFATNYQLTFKKAGHRRLALSFAIELH